VAAVERMTGEQFMYVTDIARQDWDTNQAMLVAKRNQEIEDITAQINDLTEKIRSEDDEEKKAELLARQQRIVIPGQYEPKSMPEWIRQRLVQ